MSAAVVTAPGLDAFAGASPGVDPERTAAESLAAKMFPTTVPCLSTAARLGLAAALDDGPLTRAELATVVGAAEDALHKVLAVLTDEGVFDVLADGRIAHSPLSRVLSPAHPRSLHAMALLIGDDWLWRCWNHLPAAVATGRSAFDLAFGQSAWSWLQTHPDHARTFHQAMAAFSTTVVDQLVAVLPVAAERTVCDLGGGTGTYLAAILRAHPGLEHGVVVDSEAVVAQARAAAAAPDLVEAGRLSYEVGDFLQQVPSADLYVAKQILHSWPDEDIVTLLRRVHEAAPRSRVVVAEFVGEDDAPRFARDFDLTMFLTMPGSVRGDGDLRRVFSEAGYDVVAVHPTGSTLSLVEATPRASG